MKKVVSLLLGLTLLLVQPSENYIWNDCLSPRSGFTEISNSSNEFWASWDDEIDYSPLEFSIFDSLPYVLSAVGFVVVLIGSPQFFIRGPGCITNIWYLKILYALPVSLIFASVIALPIFHMVRALLDECQELALFQIKCFIECIGIFVPRITKLRLQMKKNTLISLVDPNLVEFAL